ncbi:protein-lysine N-methyltransferase efm4 [Mayamaea pseudoterrestris]|nr:protein-lysine N-methyltransferase efm4 [Mayamaea pseudoterrestris]
MMNVLKTSQKRRSGLILLISYNVYSTEAWISRTGSLSRHFKQEKGLFARNDAIPYNDDDDDDSLSARSSFGTKQYWDDVYAGRGDFPADEYSWYYDFDVIQKHLPKNIDRSKQHVFVPGIGNDPIILDLMRAGFRNLTAQDYSKHAIERQRDLLDGDARLDDDEYSIQISHGNVLQLPVSYSNRFDMILEKGLLDAVYLSGDGRVEQAVSILLPH